MMVVMAPALAPSQAPSDEPESDYEGFCRHLAELDQHGASISLSDLESLARQYNTPIPDEILEHRRKLAQPATTDQSPSTPPRTMHIPGEPPF